MGLGKTLQVLSFLVALMEQQGSTGTGPHLIVMPLSVMTSWRSDIEKYIPAGVTDVHVHLGTREERECGFGEWHRRLKEQYSRGNTSRVFLCLTSYSFAINDIDLFRRLRQTKRNTNLFWDYLIVDEAHRLKNSESKLFGCLLQLKSQRHLLLTGTLKLRLVNILRRGLTYIHTYIHTCIMYIYVMYLFDIYDCLSMLCV
jgi:SNF2 family DNA or RNA helicase